MSKINFPPNEKEENLNHYKGIFHQRFKETKYFKYGAHFKYKDLCLKLDELLSKNNKDLLNYENMSTNYNYLELFPVSNKRSSNLDSMKSIDIQTIHMKVDEKNQKKALGVLYNDNKIEKLRTSVEKFSIEAIKTLEIRKKLSKIEVYKTIEPTQKLNKNKKQEYFTIKNFKDSIKSIYKETLNPIYWKRSLRKIPEKDSNKMSNISWNNMNQQTNSNLFSYNSRNLDSVRDNKIYKSCDQKSKNYNRNLVSKKNNFYKEQNRNSCCCKNIGLKNQNIHGENRFQIFSPEKNQEKSLNFLRNNILKSKIDVSRYNLKIFRIKKI